MRRRRIACATWRRSRERRPRPRRNRRRLNLTQPGEYGLFTILRAHARDARRSVFGRLRETDGGTPSNEQTSRAGLEQLEGRSHARGAVAAR